MKAKKTKYYAIVHGQYPNGARVTTGEPWQEVKPYANHQSGQNVKGFKIFEKAVEFFQRAYAMLYKSQGKDLRDELLRLELVDFDLPDANTPGPTRFQIKDLGRTQPSNPNAAQGEQSLTGLTGRKGEELVFKYLKSTVNPDEVSWENDEKEQNLHYDIHYKLQGLDHYVEVKSTLSTSANFIGFFSQAQQQFGKEKGCFYSVYKGQRPKNC
ncbi:MAG: DUF3883 domain-containing protein [Opitutales bacterium]|nr:DUF3883 domain-containing protein [Opitutales bacterium]